MYDYHMARSLSQSFFRTYNSTTGLFAVKSPVKPHVFRLVPMRNQSSHSENPQVVAPNPVDSSDIELREALAVQRIEDAIHRIIVCRSAPDWLPFRPGSSYWVPPRRRSYGIFELVHKLANTPAQEEVMSLTTVRGWPSSAFFVESPSPIPAKVETTSTNMPEDEDEEG